MTTDWANTEHITAEDEAEHAIECLFRSLQNRIDNLGSTVKYYGGDGREYQTYYADSEEDVIDILEKILGGKLQ